MEREKLVTELEIALDRLRRSQTLAKVGTWEFDPKTEKVWWSDAVYEILGFEPQSLDPDFDLVLELTHPDDVDNVRTATLAAVKSKTTYDIDHRGIREDGTIIFVHERGEIICDDDGNVIRIDGTVQDITERKAAEAELKESERELRIISNLSPVGVYRTNKQGDTIYVNSKLEEVTGLVAEQQFGSGWTKSLHPEDYDRVISEWHDAVARGVKFRNEYRMITPEEHCHWIYDQAAPEHDETGQWVGYVGAITVIDDLKATQAALEESELSLQTMNRLSPVGIYRTDVAGRILYINEKWHQVTGVEVVEGDLVDWARSLHPDDRERVIAKWTAAVADGVAYTAEYRLADSEGRYRWIYDQATLEHDETGRRIGHVGTYTDITQQKHTEQALAESEERFSLAILGSNDGLWDWDFATGYVYRSPRYLEMLGYECGDMPDNIGDVSAFVHPDDRPRVNEFWSECTENEEKIHELEFRIRHKDGHYINLLSSGRTVLDGGGIAIRTVGTISDISARKRAEAELLSVRTQAESEKRVRWAFENVTVGNIVITTKGIIEIFNSAAEKIFGHTAEEVIGQNVKMLMPAGESDHHDGYLRNYLSTGDAKIIGIGREVTGLRKNGEEFPMHLGVGEMIIGGEVSFIGSVTDLSEMKSLEDQLRRSQRLEAVGQLTGGIAHDFNNLLAIIVGNAELLAEMVGSDDGMRSRVKAIQTAVERGSSLTSRLLAFSRKQTLSPVSADISGLIGGLEDMLKRALGETTELKVEPMSDLWPATIDPHQFENALVNLAINARDAMPEGGTLIIEAANTSLDETYAVRHEGAAPGDYVNVAVTDTGFGMPRAVLEKVFEPFFTTKEVGKGSGLGLSMVYGFVKQTGGYVTIDSEVDRGTTVNLYLPRSTKVAVQDIAVEDLVGVSTGSERILIVEDDEGVREVAVSLLAGQGYEIVEATDGEGAIALLADGEAFDLLFTDVVLPGGMNGVMIAEEALRLQPNIKVLFTTGYAENAVIDDGRMDPGLTLVNKPYHRTELLEKVRARLDSDDA